MATNKQKAAAKKILENHGNVSKTMLEVGYSPNTAKNPKELTESKGWLELMGEILPDKAALKRHEKIILKGKDSDAIKGIDMQYKLKGYYAPEKKEIVIEAPLSEEDKKLAKRLAELEKDNG